MLPSEQITLIPPPSARADVRGSRLLTRMLVPALQLWLRSQVQQVEQLQVRLQAGDRQLFSGYLPQVGIAAQQVIYQGLHLSELQLQAEKIRLNLTQMVRGHPLQLLEPVSVQVNLQLTEADLNASLQWPPAGQRPFPPVGQSPSPPVGQSPSPPVGQSPSPLMAAALVDLLQRFRQRGRVSALLGEDSNSAILQRATVTLTPEQVGLEMHWLTTAGETTALSMRSGLHLASSRLLQFTTPRFTGLNATQPLPPQEDLFIDLGTQVCLKELQISTGVIRCRGLLTIYPSPTPQ